MISAVRPFFGKIGIALFGPNPKEEERRERQEQIRILQNVVSSASEFRDLAQSRPFQAWQSRAQKRLKEMNDQLRHAKADEFAIVQARLLAFEEAINIVPNLMEEAELAQEEINRLERE